MTCLALAASMPPHARVNYHCYPVWNKYHTDLEIVWAGATYTQPFETMFYIEPAGDCSNLQCVMRLFCTDSGAVGHYANSGISNIPLTVKWLLDNSVNYTSALYAVSPNGNTIAHSNDHGQGTVVVVGNTLYFYTFDHRGSGTVYEPRQYGFPRLSSMVFDEYREGVNGNQLVRRVLDAFDVLEYPSSYWWYSYFSPLYPSGPDSVTLSVENWYINSVETSHSWAIDVAITTAGQGERGPFVLYDLITAPSVYSASRQFITTPRYTCYSNIIGTVMCAAIPGNGRYAWDSTTTALGWSFAGLTGRFTLPSLWLHTDSSSSTYTLASSGLGPIMAIGGSTLHAVVSAANSVCTSGFQLELHKIDLTTGGQSAESTGVIGCAANLTIPKEQTYEVSYSATTVKWIGPWVEDYVLFVAKDLSEGDYYGPETPGRGCQIGWWPDGDVCRLCTPGYYCEDGRGRKMCADGLWTESGARKVSQCVDCQSGYWCAQGNREACSFAKWSNSGASSCEQCHAGYFTATQPGSDAPYVNSGASYCTICPTGYRCDGGNKILCDSGEYAANETGHSVTSAATQCVLCPAGYACPNRQLGEPCNPGSASVLGDGECRSCEAYSYQPDSGQTECRTCEPGHFTAREGYTSILGADSCTLCIPGFACDGSVSIPCPRGTASAEGQAECTRCGPGTYPASGDNTESSATICARCPSGYACDGESITECTVPLGEGAASCEPCGTDQYWRDGECVDCNGSCTTRVVNGLVLSVPTAKVQGAAAAIPPAIIGSCIAAMALMALVTAVVGVRCRRAKPKNSELIHI